MSRVKRAGGLCNARLRVAVVWQSAGAGRHRRRAKSGNRRRWTMAADWGARAGCWPRGFARTPMGGWADGQMGRWRWAGPPALRDQPQRHASARRLVPAPAPCCSAAAARLTTHALHSLQHRPRPPFLLHTRSPRLPLSLCPSPAALLHPRPVIPPDARTRPLLPPGTRLLLPQLALRHWPRRLRVPPARPFCLPRRRQLCLAQALPAKTVRVLSASLAPQQDPFDATERPSSQQQP